MDIFWEIHSGLPQEAPGSDEATLKALAMIDDLPSSPRILDVGCGPGRQSIALARATGGHIIAVDTHRPFLDDLQRRASVHGVAAQVSILNRSMTEMEFDDDAFDLIWSEGAIYIMGFENGLNRWRNFIKPGGYLAVTELTWLTDNPPLEAKNFWRLSYPAMSNRERNLALIKDAGYIPIGNFVLPDSAWWDGYYRPLEKRVSALSEKYADRPEILAKLKEELAEIDLFRKYSFAYGYIFYVMRRA